MVRLAAAFLTIALALPAFAGGVSAPVQSKKQAEFNVLTVPFIAAEVGDDTRAICTGVGHHVGAKYKTFVCRISHFEGGLLVVRYLAGAGGHFRVVLT